MSEDQHLQFGRYLAQLREEAGLSMNGLAELADVNAAYISRIERGIKYPSFDIIRKLHPYLNASLLEMLVQSGKLPEGDDLLDDDTREILGLLTPAKRKILLLLNQLDNQTITCLGQTLELLIADLKKNDQVQVTI